MVHKDVRAWGGRYAVCFDWFSACVCVCLRICMYVCMSMFLYLPIYVIICLRVFRVRNCNRKLEKSTAPTKAKTGEPAYPQTRNQKKIDKQRSRYKESGRQTVSRLWWKTFGVETGIRR